MGGIGVQGAWGGRVREGGVQGWVGDLDLDLGADPKACRTPGEEHDGFPDDSAYRPAFGWVGGMEGAVGAWTGQRGIS